MDAESPSIMVIHCSNLRSSSPKKYTYCSGIMCRLQVLVNVSWLKSIKLPKKSHCKAKATMLELWLLRLMIHDPVSRVLHLVNVRGASILVKAESDPHS